MNLDACWSEICEVDVEPLREWLESSKPAWGEVASETKPQRIRGGGLPTVLVMRIYEQVVPYFPTPLPWADSPMLSRMRPGQSHPMHVDNQRSNWITRVHVPVVTNEGCWMAFEEQATEEVTSDYYDCDGVRFQTLLTQPYTHFAAGHAYTFNATRRHAFGNDGETDRVHLIFDVLRSDV